MKNITLKKCDCCDNRILSIRGELIYADCDENQLFPVADLSIKDLKCLLKQIRDQLNECKND
jgi:hypothetical protein